MAEWMDAGTVLGARKQRFERTVGQFRALLNEGFNIERHQLS